MENIAPTSSKPPAVFKRCGLCTAFWSDRNAFLADPGVRLVGYQPNFRDLVSGLFLFQHRCGTSLALPAAGFTDLYDGPVFEPNRRGEASCPGYCLNETELRRCPVACECAFVREILQIIRHWPKNEG